MTTIEEWTEQARCRKMDPELFFPHPGDSSSCVNAKLICAECPVKNPCLEYALADPSLAGIWGGTTFRERRRLRASDA